MNHFLFEDNNDEKILKFILFLLNIIHHLNQIDLNQHYHYHFDTDYLYIHIVFNIGFKTS